VAAVPDSPGAVVAAAVAADCGVMATPTWEVGLEDSCAHRICCQEQARGLEQSRGQNCIEAIRCGIAEPCSFGWRVAAGSS
jgi:hypothetical protein